MAAGIDPSAHRQAQKAVGSMAVANSFEIVAREWFAVPFGWLPMYLSVRASY
ncbi:MAG: hypothetical protein WCD18_13535 [Thermosynechococcaceae cyanobacterium]